MVQLQGDVHGPCPRWAAPRLSVAASDALDGQCTGFEFSQGRGEGIYCESDTRGCSAAQASLRVSPLPAPAQSPTASQGGL